MKWPDLRMLFAGKAADDAIETADRALSVAERYAGQTLVAELERDLAAGAAVQVADRLTRERDEARAELASVRKRYDQAQLELLQAGTLAQRLAAQVTRLELEVETSRKHTCGKASADELRAWSKRVEDLQRENERLTTELLAARGHDTSPDHRSPLGTGFIGRTR